MHPRERHSNVRSNRVYANVVPVTSGLIRCIRYLSSLTRRRSFTPQVERFSRLYLIRQIHQEEFPVGRHLKRMPCRSQSIFGRARAQGVLEIMPRESQCTGRHSSDPKIRTTPSSPWRYPITSTIDQHFGLGIAPPIASAATEPARE